MMLDSTAVVAAEREGKNARQLLEAVALETRDDGIAVSVVTLLELAHGITRSDTVERRERRQRFLDELLAGVPIQPVTVPIALRAGQIDGQSQATGVRIPLSDLLIGTSAMELGYAVGTANVRYFRLIPGLTVVQLSRASRGHSQGFRFARSTPRLLYRPVKSSKL
jgi:tRNA(fMet)-specific endonuclease VapC